MNINWGKIAGLALALIPQAVHSIESLIGESQSGASKQQMATDALNDALTGALTVTTGGNAELAQVAAAGALAGINLTAQFAQAVKNGKAAGTYQDATAKGNALQAKIAAMTSPAKQSLPEDGRKVDVNASVADVAVAASGTDDYTPPENAS